ncbi:acetoacetate decarboxylase family protein [Polynucleobacter necessarius]|uniref:acetoacetate decarboxylase family protein n=1 Tax=Polynucleobacter necessarius TaxID=576610 RepID=UPI0022B2655C|nr:acetoacetate decarboxylase family protein [Polynucleobacter necessarius]
MRHHDHGIQTSCFNKSDIEAALKKPNYVLKIIPHVDGTPRICELLRYFLKNIVVKEVWISPADLQLFNHVMADVAKLPVLEVLSAKHFLVDITLELGEVVHDYMLD